MSAARRLLLTLLALGGLALAGCPAPRPVAQPLTAYPPSSQPAKGEKPADERAYWRGRSDLIKLPRVAAGETLSTKGLQRLKLKNGLEVVIFPDRRLPLVELQVAFKVGAMNDPADKVGLAEFTVGMLRQGTKKMDADTLSETVDSAGAGLGASSDYELSTLSCSGRTRTLDLCLGVLADLAQRPTFPAKEMDEIRDRLLGAIKETRDDPASLAEQHFNNLLYGDDHPAGRPMTPESVQRIKREDLVAFHKQHFVPARAVIGVSGDVDPAQLASKLERAFGGWRARATAGEAPRPASDPPPGLRVLLVDKPDLSQSFFALGHLGIKRTDPERDAVMVANYVLGGGGFSSRLMQVVRADGGKTYGIRSQFDEGSVDGSFVVQSFTRNDQLVAMLQLVRGELARLGASPPSDDELRGAKGDLAGGFTVRLQTRAMIVSRLLRAQLFGLPDTFVTEFPLRIEALTQGAVARAARAKVRPGRMVAAVVGKASVVGPLLRAAKIPFEQVSYLDPVSAVERRREKEPVKVEVTPAEEKAARPILQKALVAAGGRDRLSLIRTMRLVGEGQVEEVAGSFTLLVVLPDHLRLTFDFKQGAMVQVLAGAKAYVQVGTAKKALPDEVRERMRGMIWRDPVLLPLHALEGGVRARLSKDPELKKDRRGVAVELFPPGLPPTTVLIDRRGRLLQIRHQGRSGQLRVVDLAGHKAVTGGVLAPHEVTEVTGKRKQTVRYTAIELNPKIGAADVTR